jgi:hypothetical protein
VSLFLQVRVRDKVKLSVSINNVFNATGISFRADPGRRLPERANGSGPHRIRRAQGRLPKLANQGDSRQIGWP